MDVLGLEPHHEVADVEADVDQQQVGALAAAQHVHRLFDGFGVGDRCAIIHRDLGGGRELALQGADDEKPHECLLLVWSRESRALPLGSSRNVPP